MQTAELVMERSPKAIIETADAPVGIKTMLFHVQIDRGLSDRVQVALSLARAFGAHLHLLHVTPIEAYTMADSFNTLVSADVIGVLEQEAAKLREKLEQQLANEDVSWDYEEVTGALLPHLVQRAALSDLVLTGRNPSELEFGPAITLLGDMLHRVRAPLFVIGDDAREVDPFGPAMVAWNGSYEAADALRSAVPLLKLASQVRVITVEEPKDYRFPSTGALEYMSRHGIHAELVVRPRIDESIEEELLEQAAADRASYIVMGGYSHARAGEFLFGGVTRSLLKKCPVSLVMAH